MFGKPSPEVQAQLCGYVREQNERGIRTVEFNQELVGNIHNLVPQGVQEKADRLLQAIARKSQWPGFMVRLEASVDYPLGYCVNESEFFYFLSSLQASRMIDNSATSEHWDSNLTMDGWAYLDQLRKSNRESLKVFVAMGFADELHTAFTEGIKPAAETCGYRPLRIDNKEYLGGIFDEIIAEIRESRFVVADLTLQRQGVYYEAGYALGLGLPVVLTCREDDLKNVHFDAKHMNILVWKTPAELVAPLRNRIRAVIGLAPGVPS
jgi:nucleoside 2-deoxyribosyltransferase